MRCEFTSKHTALDGLFLEFQCKKGLLVNPKYLCVNHLRLAYVEWEITCLRKQFPLLIFHSEKISPIIVGGEWYCPNFIFFEELGNSFEDPKIELMETSFYKIELEKFLEEIYNTGGEDTVVCQNQIGRNINILNENNSRNKR